MGEANKGVVKHVFILKMKEGLSNDQIEQMNKDYANLVNLVPSMKALQWGKLEVNNKLGNGGYTHIFESTFESMEGVAEYADHPAHLHLRNLYFHTLDKFLVFDYKPTIVLPNSS
ncbi:stress-response A/B barrel domain-containing protein HS1-like [Cannabis sativa]|uniref:stress-response A/B barrel domain-containing protein HS1-like n=1 Tax=Cannabis sativa TaxID=3483 RepID=UPI0029C9BFF4|nr:stress-response A/B barrel domain-containing protein HS1-like [Cannabis sativa]